jgi:hypothetical protein
MSSQLPTNLLFVDILNEWNPFQLKNGNYEIEIADTIQAIHELDTPSELAEKIQVIYEFSFEKIIPMESCLKVAKELLVLKDSGTCSL